MTNLPITVCNVNTPEGPKDYVACLPPEVLQKRGLAAEAIVGVLLKPTIKGEPIKPENFARNGAFVDFMHDVIARRAPGLPAFISEARRQVDGFIYIIDQRTLRQDQVPAEDVIGAFEIKNGDVAGAYKPNPQHRVLSTRGFVRLDPQLLTCFMEELMKKV